MNKRKLGNSPLEVVPLMFGGNVFGWTVDEATSFKLLDAFIDAGFDFIDTADVYSAWKPGNRGGESETIIGNWLRRSGKRQQIILATKVGMEMGENKKGLSKKYIFSAVEASLKRLQTDYIDLYQSHKDDPATPVEETLSAYAELVMQGKVRVIGASNFSAARLAESLQLSQTMKIPSYQTLQPLYNLYDRAEYETDLEPLCVQHGLGVIPYFSLASGFLTGKYRSEKDLEKYPRGSRVKKYLNDRGLTILSALDKVAVRTGAEISQIALAWILARPSITAPIVSASTLDQMESLFKASRLELSREDIQFLNAASDF
jgi:aryl-alcohol dehydrogenase-like predicted oxidoreductase